MTEQKPQPEEEPKRTEGGQPNNKNAEKWTEKKAISLGKALLKWLKKDEKHIFYEEFLIIEKNHHPCTITYLSNKFASFSKLIERSKKIQELKMVKWGTAKKLDATMTKFCLINHHGYKSEKIDHTSKDEKINVIMPQVPVDIEE